MNEGVRGVRIATAGFVNAHFHYLRACLQQVPPQLVVLEVGVERAIGAVPIVGLQRFFRTVLGRDVQAWGVLIGLVDDGGVDPNSVQPGRSVSPMSLTCPAPQS